MCIYHKHNNTHDITIIVDLFKRRLIPYCTLCYVSLHFFNPMTARQIHITLCTELNKGKLKRLPQPNRTEPFWKCLRYLRTLRIVLSLVRHRVTRRHTRLQIMHNVLQYRNIW